MNAHNLVSYLVGWNRLVLKWIDLDAEGVVIDFPETGFQWNQLGPLARKFYSDYEDIAFDQLLNEFKNAKQEIVSFILNQTDEHLIWGKLVQEIHPGAYDPVQHLAPLCQSPHTAAQMETNKRHHMISSEHEGDDTLKGAFSAREAVVPSYSTVHRHPW